MDRKAKKRVAVLKGKRENLRKQLAVVRKFTDDPAEIPKLEQELAKVIEELERLLAAE